LSLSRHDAQDVLDSFFVARKCETRGNGGYVTEHLVVTECDAMAAVPNSTPFRSPLTPPSGRRPPPPTCFASGQ
jgi:hypothetical protein